MAGVFFVQSGSARVMNERKDETTNHPQRKTKLETRYQEESNHVTRQFTRCRSSQPEKYKAPYSQTGETTTGTRKELFLSRLSALGSNCS